MVIALLTYALPPNSSTTTATTAAHWDWKRRALTVPLEAFVKCTFLIKDSSLQEQSDP
ncbi:Hypothetical protein B839_37940 [Vibrio cholerae O1 str. Inaba G4222]|nr:Hypothetical protein B839_37940 [Vibrio cholerae O1 str. Inaba G4222]